MNDELDIFETKDKQFTPYLFIQPDVKFLGTRIQDSTVFFRFSPSLRCKTLLNLFISKQAPPVQGKSLLDALESYRDLIFEMKMKMKEKHYEP